MFTASKRILQDIKEKHMGGICVYYTTLTNDEIQWLIDMVETQDRYISDLANTQVRPGLLVKDSKDGQEIQTG